jgi:hypothetical protein
MKRFRIFILILTFLFSCSKSDEGKTIADDLFPYYENFIYEAEIRKIKLLDEDLDILMYFADIPNNNTLGQCRFTAGSNLIEIDRFYWRSLDEVEKEFLIFHELGHCVLQRGHRDDTDANGNCRSLMHSVVGICNFDFTGPNRTLYIDELFN